MFRLTQFLQEFAAFAASPTSGAARSGCYLEPDPAVQSHLQALLLDLR